MGYVYGFTTTMSLNFLHVQNIHYVVWRTSKHYSYQMIVYKIVNKGNTEYCCTSRLTLSMLK